MPDVQCNLLLFFNVNSKILESISCHFSVLLLTQRVNIYVTVSGPTEPQSPCHDLFECKLSTLCQLFNNHIFLQPTYDQQVFEHFIALQIPISFRSIKRHTRIKHFIIPLMSTWVFDYTLPSDIHCLYYFAIKHCHLEWAQLRQSLMISSSHVVYGLNLYIVKEQLL